MQSIQDWWGRSKGHLDEHVGEWRGFILEYLTPIIVILVGLASFGLGRLSAYESSRPPVSVRQAPFSDAKAMVVGGQVVASRSGNTYHFPWCPGAAAMKESNKIWFKDEAAARAAGYTPAKNCDGLE